MRRRTFSSLAAHFIHLKSELRARDLPSYSALAHAPTKARPGILALRAFNVEIAAVRDAVRDAQHGRMRIQWWRDTLDATFAGRPPALPVALALAPVIQKYSLERATFEKYLDARVRLLWRRPICTRHFLNCVV
jgi:phytoene/squalene synthetase